MNKKHIILFIVAILLGGLRAEVIPDNMAEYFAPRENILGLPDFKSNLPNARLARVEDRRKAYRMISLQIPNDITEEWADAKARELKELGFNFILSEGCRDLMQDETEKPSPRYANSRKLGKLIADSNIMIKACHKYGMDFIHHITCTMVDAAIFEKHPGWKAINLNTGNSDINGYGTANTCINNDDFWKVWFANLNRLLTEAPCEGIMIDEIQFFGMHLCGCDYCLKKFTADTGYEAPVVKHFGEWARRNPAARIEWLHWRARKVRERHLECRALLRGINPEATYSIYLCNNSSGYSYNAAGLEIGGYLPFGDSIGLESEPHDHSYIHYWPLMFLEMKYLRAVAEHTGNAFWALYYTRSPAHDILSYYIGLSQGGRHWWYMRQNDNGQGWRPLLQWEVERQNLLIDTHAYNDVALLFSHQTRDKNVVEPYIWLKSFASTCNALTFHNTPYRVVIDRDLEDAKALSHKASTVMAIDAACWNDRQVAAVVEFVKDGGTLITGANVALTTPEYKKNDNFAIRDLLGFDYDGTAKGDFNFVIKDQAFGTPGEKIPYSGPVTKIKNIDKDVSVAAEFVSSKGETYPALLVKGTGKGKTAYFAGIPYNCYFYNFYNEANVIPGEVWKDRRNPQWGAFFNRLATFNVSKPVMKVDNIPYGVVVEAHRQAFGTGSSIQVHLANFLGAMTKEGMQPKLRELNFPPIAEHRPDKSRPMSISVKAPNAHSLYLFSPDFDEIVEWKFSKDGEYVNFTLPDFARYLVAYLAEGEIDELKRVGRPFVKVFPAAKTVLQNNTAPLPGKYDAEAPIAFADTEAFQGGVKWKVWFQQEPITIVYGDMSKATTTSVTLEVKSVLKNPELVLGGMDDNRTTSRAPIKIEFQGRTIHNGTTDYPDNAWAVHSFPLGMDVLQPGKYTVTISNTGKGPIRNVPWFGVSFVQLRARR